MSNRSFSRTERRILCPLNAGSVAAGTTVSFTTRPQVNFQPDQLIVGPGVAANFALVSMTIGIQPQVASSGEVPCDAFPPNGAHFAFDVCDTGTDIITSVRNTDGAAAHVFSAMLVGYQVEIG